MADKPAVVLTNATATNVNRNIIGTVTKDGKQVAKKDAKGNNVTKDGLDHGCTATVAQMRSATDGADFLKAADELFAAVAAIEGGKLIGLQDSKGNVTNAEPKSEFVDGKRVVIRNKDIYPTTFAKLAEYINSAIQATCAASETAFNNKFKSSYGGAATPAGSALDDNADLA